MHVGVYTQPRAQLLLSHICIFVLASLISMDFLLFYYIINCSVDMNNFILYQHFIFSEFNRSWMSRLSKHFLLIVITLQVLHFIFKSNKNGFGYRWIFGLLVQGTLRAFFRHRVMVMLGQLICGLVLKVFHNCQVCKPYMYVFL